MKENRKKGEEIGIKFNFLQILFVKDYFSTIK